MSEFSHLDKKGKLAMVDVSEKEPTTRSATAEGRIFLAQSTLKKVEANEIAKGDIYNAARVAGVQAAKKTAELIPLCHPLLLSWVNIDIFPDAMGEKNALRIVATVKARETTGVEMEALTAVSVAALTIYDMCKAVDKEILIGDIFLREKKGGKSDYRKSE